MLHTEDWVDEDIRDDMFEAGKFNLAFSDSLGNHQENPSELISSQISRGLVSTKVNWTRFRVLGPKFYSNHLATSAPPWAPGTPGNSVSTLTSRGQRLQNNLFNGLDMLSQPSQFWTRNTTHRVSKASPLDWRSRQTPASRHRNLTNNATDAHGCLEFTPGSHAETNTERH
jgi:hypothetical protein